MDIPDGWTYLDWYKHMVCGVESEYGCRLALDDGTRWRNVPPALKRDIEIWEHGRLE